MYPGLQIQFCDGERVRIVLIDQFSPISIFGNIGKFGHFGHIGTFGHCGHIGYDNGHISEIG